MRVFAGGALAALTVLLLEVTSLAASSAVHLVSVPVVILPEPAILILMGGGFIGLANLVRRSFDD
jgi:hypothetical protein